VSEADPLRRALRGRREALAVAPQLAALRGLRENNDWHADDPLEQSLRVARWLRGLAEAQPAPAALARVIGGRRAGELLAFAGLLHDVGKAATYVVAADGSTRCAGHEAAGAAIAAEVCASIGLARPAAELVVRLVAAHGEPYACCRPGAEGAALRQEHRRRLEAEWGADFLLLLLLAYADFDTSHLRRRAPAKAAAVEACYLDWPAACGAASDADIARLMRGGREARWATG
jgi:hypothetical protein